MGRHAAFAYCLFLTSGFAADYTVVDIERVPLSGDPASAVVKVTIPDHVPEVACDVLVAGAGMGGIGGALAVARHGRTVCLSEETSWIGGQATTGGVSALDENRFIEIAGGTREYYRFRAAIRAAYGGISN